jgi:hypothetical protein
MPKLGVSSIKRIVLPSTIGSKDEAWVDLNIDVPIGFMMDHAKNDLTDSSAAGLSIKVMVEAIVDWNFFDDKGNKEPINEAAIKRLAAIDFSALADALRLPKKDGSDTKESLAKKKH